MSDRLPRVVFLDVDGPVIPGSMFFLHRNASLERHFAPHCIAAVKRLLEVADAKLVTNSTHNYHVNQRTNLTLRGDLIAAGIPEERFHEDWRTIYPGRPPDGLLLSRLDAINDWLARNGKHDWVCFDDIAFANDDRLIVVDFDDGVSVKEFNLAARVFGLKPFQGF